MKEIYKSKKGFTLLELVLTLVIISIGGVFLASFALPMINLYTESSKEMEARSMADTIFNQLLKELEFAKEFKIDNGDNTRLTYKYPAGDNFLAGSKNGKSLGKEIFPKTKFNIKTSFSLNNNLLIIRIKIDDEKAREIAMKEYTLLSPNQLYEFSD